MDVQVVSGEEYVKWYFYMDTLGTFARFRGLVLIPHSECNSVSL